MGCGIGFVKCLLFFFNFIVALCGLLFVVLGAANLPYHDESLQPFAIVLIVLGGVVFIIAFFGCCGAVRESRCMIITFAVFLLLLLILELAVGVLLYLHRHELQNSFLDDLEYFDGYPSGNKTIDDAVDETQQTFSCCGLEGPNSYTDNGWSIPPSCCEEPAMEDCVKNGKIYTTGCDESIHMYLSILGYLAVGTFGIIGLVEIIGLCFSCCLVNSINNKIRRGRL